MTDNGKLTHPKKRLEIIIEAPALPRLAKILEAETKGYTVLEASAGYGSSGPWQAEATVSDADRMVAVICILGEHRLDACLDRIRKLLGRQIGVVSITDVDVLRAERF